MNKNLIMKLAKMLAKFEEVKTDKATLTVDGELAVGVEVFVEKEGEMVAPEDGEYVLEDEKTIVIADGKVSEIKEKEAEEVVEEHVEESMAKQKFDAVKAKFEATYQEVENAIYAALNDKGIWGYLVENTSEYAIVSVWAEDGGEHLYKYELSIKEDGSVELGEYVEVKTEYVESEIQTEPAVEEEMAEEKQEEVLEDATDDKDARIAELEAQIAEKDAKIAELQAALDELNKPVEEPLQMSKTVNNNVASKVGALKYFE